MDDRIKTVIENVVRERFAGSAIEDVRIFEDVDFEGQPVLRVTVIFEPKRGKLDAEKTSGITRHIRHKLLEMNEEKFPFFRFVSKADAKALKAAAA